MILFPSFGSGTSRIAYSEFGSIKSRMQIVPRYLRLSRVVSNLVESNTALRVATVHVVVLQVLLHLLQLHIYILFPSSSGHILCYRDLKVGQPLSFYIYFKVFKLHTLLQNLWNQFRCTNWYLHFYRTEIPVSNLIFYELVPNQPVTSQGHINKSSR